MSDETKTPLEIAREVWGELEWVTYGVSTLTLCAYLPVVGWLEYRRFEGFDYWKEGDGTGKPLPDLRAALLAAKVATHKALTEAAAKCSPYPVPVVFHGAEAVLMLTSHAQGYVLPVPVRLIVEGAGGVAPMYADTDSPSRVDTGDRIYIVAEFVEDIRQTLHMLGGEE